MKRLSDRVGLFTESVIRRLTRISDEYDAINLSQGFPDFDPPKPLMDALARVAYEGPHQYPVTYGAENLREALAERFRKRSGLTVDPETQVLVTCGGTEAMMCAMMAICNPGDKVLVFSPFYENYGADAILSGAEPIYIPLVPPDYHYEPALIEAGFRDGAKCIIICNPSNPCGKVFTREELTEIGALAEKYDAWVVTDEVYEYMVYKPNVHTVMASLPGMAERTVTCNSLSKTFSVTGWRLGFMIGPEEVLEGAKKVHDFLTVGAPSPLQEAATVGLGFGEEYYKELNRMYEEKRDYFLAGLDRIGLRHNIPQGTYFIMADISDFLLLPQFEGYTDLEFCEWMIREIGVAAVPGSSFFREPVYNLIRLHFAREKNTLDEVIRRLSRMMVLLNKRGIGTLNVACNYNMRMATSTVACTYHVCRIKRKNPTELPVGLNFMIFVQPTRFRISVSRTNASANHFVAFASFASSVLALPFDKNVSAPPDIAPERPALFPLCISTITVRASPARS